MDQKRLAYFRGVLLTQLRKHVRSVNDDQAAAIETADDGAMESADAALRDSIQDVTLKLGEKESKLVADIDQALMRIEEGSYGICVRCGKTIDERRLEAMPTARYDADCQNAIEQEQGISTHLTL